MTEKFDLHAMYPSLKLAWSDDASQAEKTYHDAGYVKTKGTLFLLPPTETVLRTTYNMPPRPKTRMSSGAVALCKHFERGGASSEHGRPHSFWTLPVGSNENKTEIAGQILDQMLAQAVWRNVMLLHHGVAVYEIRNSLGYGMRWTLQIAENKDDHGSEGNMEETNKDQEDIDKDWKIMKTTFRGFLEPIVDMDHELPGEAAIESIQD